MPSIEGSKEQKWVYLFDESSTGQSYLLGEKGARLGEMTLLGLPVPLGFTVTTAACQAYHKSGKQFPPSLWSQVLEALHKIEERVGKRFGDTENPLLLAVRPSAKFSMPGLMSGLLNIGLSDRTLSGLIAQSGNECFAYDAYRYLLQMFGTAVFGINSAKFKKVSDESRGCAGNRSGTERKIQELKNMVATFKSIIETQTGKPFPQDPIEQLRNAIMAVFESWSERRAIDYRKRHGVPQDLGVAVCIQIMVFGNISGVVFTRNPFTGQKQLFGRYLRGAPWEEVWFSPNKEHSIEKLKDELPKTYQQLKKIVEILERYYYDMQDVAFIIEREELWLIQSQTAKRAPKAAVRIAVEMVREGLIDKREAISRVEPEHVEEILYPRFETQAVEAAQRAGRLIAKGLSACRGAIVGKAVFDIETAVAWSKAGQSVILVRPETTPDDIQGFLHAKGVLTQRGGVTSHAAIVSRAKGIPAIVGCEALYFDLSKRQLTVYGATLQEGDIISLDGNTGNVYWGALPIIVPRFDVETELAELLSWADEIRQLGVLANVDHPEDARQARQFGAEGIGLCRTEHMFFKEDCLSLVQQMILAKSAETRRQTLHKLLPLQREEFKGIFKEMEGLPVIIRMIDPPLHEFLPNYEILLREVIELRASSKAENERLREREELLEALEKMRQVNPMLGLRGVRLGVLYPDIIEMQIQAIFEAACQLKKEGLDVRPKVIVPLVAHTNELRLMKELVQRVANQVMKKQAIKVSYGFGAMIETPRACVVADQLAEHADFFSFGTNDLTQTIYGLSRDDAQWKLLYVYESKKIFEDPFQALDEEGVGELMRWAVEKGKQTKADLEVGICGEHGGHPASIGYCHDLQLDYVSCSSFRVPVARLAAAHAVLKKHRHYI